MKLYECHNAACTLGTPGSPGRFTAGASDDQVLSLTGDPNTKGGEGVCPNCGTKGKATEEEFEPFEGKDPYQKFHDQVAARVQDEKDKLDADGAMEAVLELVEGGGK